VGPDEARIFAGLNGGPPWAAPVLWLPMQLGSLWGPFLVGAWTWRRWHRWRPAAGAVAAGVVSWQLAKVVKAAVGRGRPSDLLDGVARLPGTPRDGLGFVSGHSAVAASLMAVLSPELPMGQRLLSRLLVAVVGGARVQVSAHLPLDVVGGAALGYTVGWGWNLAVGIPVEDDAVVAGSLS
jgi:undecaprenyl-diphosphatase